MVGGRCLPRRVRGDNRQGDGCDVVTASLDLPENRIAKSEQSIFETPPITLVMPAKCPPPSLTLPFLPSLVPAHQSSLPAVHSFLPGSPFTFAFVLRGRCLQVLALRPVSSEMLLSGF